MGARVETVHATGNLKYDVRAPKHSRVAELIKDLAAGRPIIVAGSTVGNDDDDEELTPRLLSNRIGSLSTHMRPP